MNDSVTTELQKCLMKNAELNRTIKELTERPLVTGTVLSDDMINLISQPQWRQDRAIELARGEGLLDRNFTSSRLRPNQREQEMAARLERVNLRAEQRRREIDEKKKKSGNEKRGGGKRKRSKTKNKYFRKIKYSKRKKNKSTKRNLRRNNNNK
jgi:hypothetical protein